MENNSKTARPYAIAAFRQAREEGKADEWSEMLALLDAVVSDPDMRRVVASPRKSRAEVADFIIDVCGDRLSGTARNFVRVLASNRRLPIIKDIVNAFEAERAREEQRSEVHVTSAYELSTAEQNVINVAMTKRLGSKVDMKLNVDPSLIGGIIIRCGDTVIDASIRGRLNQMARDVA